MEIEGSSLTMGTDVVNDSRHSAGKASITERSLKISNGEMFNSLNL